MLNPKQIQNPKKQIQNKALQAIEHLDLVL
jgi:hypothetical protein